MALPLDFLSAEQLGEKLTAQYLELQKGLTETRHLMERLNVPIPGESEQNVPIPGESEQKVTAEMARDHLREIREMIKSPLRMRIRKAAFEMPGEFTKDDLFVWVRRRYPSLEIKEASFNVTFNQLAAIEPWTVVSKGTGSNPSRYVISPENRMILKKKWAL